MIAMQTDSRKPLGVVTGASSGIGYELAKQFAENGFDLIIASEGPAIVEAKQAFEALGAEVQDVRVDLSSSSGVEELARAIKADGRPLAALALNAGVGVGGAFAGDSTVEEQLNVIRLNVMSPVHLCKLLIGDMVEQGHGRILFTSSIAATAPEPFLAVYAASKAFLQSFAQAIRNELKDSGVTVTALMPGATETAFFARAGMQDTKVGQAEKDDPADVARDGFAAMMAGEDHVVAGSFKNKVQAAAGKVMPDAMKAAAHRKSTEPQPPA
jgi:short-subunit dehydrogenase